MSSSGAQETVQFGPIDILVRGVHGVGAFVGKAGPVVFYPLLITVVLLVAWYFEMTFLILPLLMTIGVHVHVTYWAKPDEGGGGSGGSWLASNIPWIAPYIAPHPLQGVGKALLAGHAPASDLQMKERVLVLVLIYVRLQMSIAFVLLHSFLVLHLLLQFPIFHLLVNFGYRTCFAFLENTTLYSVALLAGLIATLVASYTIDAGPNNDGGSDMDVAVTIVATTILWIIFREFGWS